MDLFWALIIIASLVILLFAVLPSFVEKRQPTLIPPPTTAPSRVATTTHFNKAKDKAMLDSHYVPARAVVPEDYPRKKIGACPYSRPPSTDLPLPDIPMCLAQKSSSMKLV